ncbi:TonB-dependent receptor, partial [Campylobacter sp. FMV-PI01]|nr:TonB-dependent receptor [Campylobacter portucalensis]
MLKNHYYRSRDTHEVNYEDKKVANNTTSGRYGTSANGALKEGWPANTVYPAGGHEFRSIYLDNTINYGIFTFNTNLNWTRYHQEGEQFYTLHQLLQKNIEKSFIDRRGKKQTYKVDYFSSLNAEFFVADGELSEEHKALRDKYFKYEPQSEDEDDESNNGSDRECQEDYCPKNGTRTPVKFKPENENKYLNYAFGLSAYIHDLFTPFVNHSKTHRAPNIKEAYFSEFGKWGVNNNLKPEVAKTWQVGFNSYKDGLFSDDDKFRFKFLTYKTKIKDYIVNTK